MRNPDSDFLAALVAALSAGIAPRYFVWVVAKNRDTGDPETVGICTMDEPVSIEVVDGETGSLTLRDYSGAGSTLKVSDIPLVSDLTIQTVTVTLSQLADDPQNLVRGYDARGARVEIHVGLRDPATRAFDSPPEIVFIGEVDGAPIETPAAGGEGAITLHVVSAAIRMLTRTNPRKRSYEGQRQRDDDQWGIYSNGAAQWVVPWGEKDAGAAGRSSSRVGTSGR